MYSSFYYLVKLFVLHRLRFKPAFVQNCFSNVTVVFRPLLCTYSGITVKISRARIENQKRQKPCAKTIINVQNQFFYIQLYLSPIKKYVALTKLLSLEMKTKIDRENRKSVSIEILARSVVIQEVLTREQRVSPYFVSAISVRYVSDDTSQCKVMNKTINLNRPDDVGPKWVHG